LLLGQAYLQAKEYQKARDQFERVLSIDPQRKEAHYMLAKVFARLGDADLAAKHRREFARLEQETSAAMEEDRVTTRNQDFHEDRPLMATFWLYAGMIHAKYGGLDEAERYCLSAATLNPQDRDIQKFLETLRASQRRRPAYPS
jgi:tetratricopeptide (TPR) repeat protein